MIEEKYLKVFDLTEYENTPTIPVLQLYARDSDIAHKMLIFPGFIRGDNYFITAHGLKYIENINTDGHGYIFDYYIIEMLHNHLILWLYANKQYGITNLKFIHHSLIDSKSIFGIKDGKPIRYSFNEGIVD